MAGIFTISLDFELHWGVFDKRDREERVSTYQNTLEVIPQLLQLFQQYKTHVTWATVGSLFAKTQQEWQALQPGLKPSYTNPVNSAYEYINQHGFNAHAHLAHKEVAVIEDYEGQELATHTFAHYYCLEKGQTAAQFDADLRAAIKASDLLGVSRPVSIVFPRNQYNKDYLKVCFENGIKVIRSNPSKWFWTGVTEEDTSLLRKIIRTGDTYLPMGGKMTYPLSLVTKQKELPLQLPASRLFRTFDAKKPLLNKLRLKRILSEMEYAAKNNECYHLWWHPEQFGDHPKESVQDLTIILQQYSKLQKEKGMQSWNMKDHLQNLG